MCQPLRMQLLTRALIVPDRRRRYWVSLFSFTAIIKYCRRRRRIHAITRTMPSQCFYRKRFSLKIIAFIIKAATPEGCHFDIEVEPPSSATPPLSYTRHRPRTVTPPPRDDDEKQNMSWFQGRQQARTSAHAPARARHMRTTPL